MFALGFITGLLVSIILILGSLISHRKGSNFNDRLEKVSEYLSPPQRGLIFKPESFKEKKRKELLESNKHEGKDTPLEELL